MFDQQRLSFLSTIDDLLMTTRMSPPSLAREYECGEATIWRALQYQSS